MADLNNRPAYLVAVQQYIEAHYNYPLNVSHLARIAGISASSLQHQFPAAFGITLQDYHAQARVNMAKQLLTGSDQSVKRIATLVGYRSSAAFSHAFKKMTGKRPSDYRNGENS